MPERRIDTDGATRHHLHAPRFPLPALSETPRRSNCSRVAERPARGARSPAPLATSTPCSAGGTSTRLLTWITPEFHHLRRGHLSGDDVIEQPRPQLRLAPQRAFSVFVDTFLNAASVGANTEYGPGRCNVFTSPAVVRSFARIDPSLARVGVPDHRGSDPDAAPVVVLAPRGDSGTRRCRAFARRGPSQPHDRPRR